MLVTLNPQAPPDTESRSLGAMRIRGLTQSILRIFGFSGSASENFEHPFEIDPASGLVTVRGDPVDDMGICTKQLAQHFASNASTSALNAAKAYTDSKIASLPSQTPLPIVRHKVVNTGPTTDGTMQSVTSVAIPLPASGFSDNVVVASGVLSAIPPAASTFNRLSYFLEFSLGGPVSQLAVWDNPWPNPRSQPYFLQNTFYTILGKATGNVNVELKVFGDAGINLDKHHLVVQLIPADYQLV
jgi:hypothetical protein